MPEQEADIFRVPDKPRSEECNKSHRILSRGYDAANEFITQFREVRKDSGRGSVKDTHQDILRAMLVFACAGFDSCLKRLLEDALQAVINADPKAEETFTDTVKRKLPDIERSRDLLAKVLTAKNPREQLVREVLADLLGQSLQSVSQYSRVLAAFNVQMPDKKKLASLKEAFEARNYIIHEMDIDFSKEKRSRRQRNEDVMTEMTKTVLATASELLVAVDKKLKD
jgi:hypothetical protein